MADALKVWQRTPTISLIISTYNRPDALKAVVEGCFAQTDKDFEIVITDDGSDARTHECVAQMSVHSPVPLEYVWQPDDGYRLAMARNRGILASRGDYVIVLDGDCIPQPDFIAQHRKLACIGYLVTGSRILLNQDTSERVLAGQLNLRSLKTTAIFGLRMRGAMNKMLPLMFKLPDVGRKSKRFSWRRIKGCNMGFWRADLERVNGFDESFIGWGHEDADLVVRLFHAGVMRKDGAFATEVFHLWHREAQRDRETSNRRVVLERAAGKVTQAVVGMRQHGTPQS